MKGNVFFEENPCELCLGTGKIDGKFGFKDADCYMCNGIGYKPSVLGQQLTEFIQRKYVGRL